jgi:hypothetical protein
MYCVYMSEEYLDDEPADALYGEYIDAEYDWRANAETSEQEASFLQDSSESDVDLLAGAASDQ